MLPISAASRPGHGLALWCLRLRDPARTVRARAQRGQCIRLAVPDRSTGYIDTARAGSPRPPLLPEAIVMSARCVTSSEDDVRRADATSSPKPGHLGGQRRRTATALDAGHGIRKRLDGRAVRMRIEIVARCRCAFVSSQLACPSTRQHLPPPLAEHRSDPLSDSAGQRLV